MKIYKCDLCVQEFDSKDGMKEGRYERVRKIQLDKKPGWGGEINEYKVRKTIELYRTTAAEPLPPTDVVVKKDLCPKCVKLLEKP